MKLTDSIKEYLQGKHKGKTANQLERQSLSDPFLYEALEGYTGYSGNPIDALNELQQKIQQQGDPHSSLKHSLKILIVIALVAGGICILWMNQDSIRNYMKSEETVTPCDSVATQDGSSTPIGTIQPNEANQATQTAATPEEEFDKSQGETEEDEPATQSFSRIQSSIQIDSIGHTSLPVCGLKAYSRYINNNLQYQEEDFSNATQGEIKTTFTINSDGFPSQIKIEKGFSQTINQDIIRLLGNGPQWSPAPFDRQIQVSMFIRFQ